MRKEKQLTRKPTIDYDVFKAVNTLIEKNVISYDEETNTITVNADTVSYTHLTLPTIYSV